LNILILNTLYTPFKVGGAEVSVQLLAEGLVSAGHQVNILSTVPKSHELADSTQSINGVAVHYLPLHNLYWPFDEGKQNKLKRLAWHLLDTYNPWMIKAVLNKVKQLKPDVIHTNNLAGFSTGILSGLSKLDSKLVHTARDYYFLHPNCTLMRGDTQMPDDALSIKFWSKIRGHFLKKVDHFIGISQFVVDKYAEYIPAIKSKAKVVYNPVLTPKGNVERPLGYINPNSVTFGFIGRLSPEKGFEDFVKLAAIAEKENWPAHFVAAGKGDQDYIKSLLNKYPCSKLQLLGFVASDQFYQSIDVLVSPIKWPEPFGRTLVESFLNNIPFIGYSGGGASELHSILQRDTGQCQTFTDLKSKVYKLVVRAYKPKLNLVNEMFMSDTHVENVISCYLLDV